MKHLPIYWNQGLFLRPHHLQAADRYWTELGETSQMWDHPYGYGLRAIDLDEDAFVNGLVRIHRLEARMRDGTLIAHDPNDAPLEINLNDRFRASAGNQPAGSVSVYVGIPNFNADGPNVADLESSRATRFFWVKRPFSDENAEAEGQTIEFRRLRIRLLFADQQDGYEVLPIGRFSAAGEQQTHPVVDETYIPPVLTVDAWPYFQRPYVQKILEQIRACSKRLADPARQLRLGFQELGPPEWYLLWMLDRLNESESALSILSPGRAVHPFLAYTELARILGRFSIFGAQRTSVQAKGYDHDNLGEIFSDIRDKILPLLRYETRFLRENFHGEQQRLQVRRLGKEWFKTEYDWYIGIDRGDDLSADQLRSFLEQGGSGEKRGGKEWEWSCGSIEDVEQNHEIGQFGVKRKPVIGHVPYVPATDNWTYYEVVRDHRESPAWRGVDRFESLAIRVPWDEDLTGKDTLRVKIDGKQVDLQFALFGVSK